MSYNAVVELRNAVRMGISEYNNLIDRTGLIDRDNAEEVREKAFLLLDLHTGVKLAISEETHEENRKQLSTLDNELERIINLHEQLLRIFLAAEDQQLSVAKTSITATTTASSSITAATASSSSTTAIVVTSKRNEKEEDDEEDDYDGCPICFNNDVSMVEISSCRHSFCSTCIGGYLNNALSTGHVLSIACPTCMQPIPNQVIVSVMGPDWSTRYEEMATKAAMRSDPNYKWCPRPGCETPVIIEDKNLPASVACPGCSYKYCPKCMTEEHPNVSCENRAQWKRDNDSSEAKFEDWKKEHDVKRCPKCQMFTEKNKGCNHMTCVSCRHQWCWLCSGEYTKDHFSRGDCNGKQFYQSDMSPPAAAAPPTGPTINIHPNANINIHPTASINIHPNATINIHQNANITIGSAPQARLAHNQHGCYLETFRTIPTPPIDPRFVPPRSMSNDDEQATASTSTRSTSRRRRPFLSRLFSFI